jgi:hypothetical protein
MEPHDDIQLVADQSLQQVADVATLPGIVDASYAMPEIHWGYGFPIGGVAATDVEDGGVVSPGGVGFDSPDTSPPRPRPAPDHEKHHHGKGEARCMEIMTMCS